MDRRELLSAVFGWFGFSSVAQSFGEKRPNDSPNQSEFIQRITIGSSRAGGPTTIKPFGRGDPSHEFVGGQTGIGKTTRLKEIHSEMAQGEPLLYDPKGES